MHPDIKTELQQHGFATVDYPKGVTGIVQNAMEAWQKFCQLPLDTKSRFIYTGDYGTGYEYNDEIGETKDRKENFHFILKDTSRLVQIAKEHNVDEAFLSCAEKLLNGIEETLCNFAERLEEIYDIHGLRDEVYESKGHWLLRYLHYFPGAEQGKVIAAHHCDKFGVTM